MVELGDFESFFKEIYGYGPFPWQTRLLHYVVERRGQWPATLDLPTGSGKTAAIDIAVFHLALEADRAAARCAPVRVAFVVDRRLVVDDAFDRARKLASALADPKGPVTAQVAEQLRKLAGDGPPLVACRLRGGIPREDDWARTPSQPTVLCSTVDQVGSRLLFRGYGISDSMKPVHAGLLGSDCLILLDEAHLAEPFRQTLGWVQRYRGPDWREVETVSPWGVTLLTATPGEEVQEPFSLNDEDRADPELRRRLEASKPARLVPPIRAGRNSEDATDADDADDEGEEQRMNKAQDLARRTKAMVEEVEAALKHSANVGPGASSPAIGVVVNRVARARAVFEAIREEFKEKIADEALAPPILLIGPARPLDRDDLAGGLDSIRTRPGQTRTSPLEKPLIIVATQCIEAGVDIDLDALITELAPLDALRQRFGRLNRAGRDIVPYAAIVAVKADLSPRYDDPVYGTALRATWEALEQARMAGDGVAAVDFGISAFAVAMTPETLARKDDAPILLPAHVDLLSQTSPVPAADPEIALYLHGPKRQPDAITVVWRADIDPDLQDAEEVRRLLTLVPPRSAEAIELPVWAVRRWLERSDRALDELADIAAAEPGDDDGRQRRRGNLRAFLWKGDDERSRWIQPDDLHPGATIVVPASSGGVDEFGWNPEYTVEQSEDGDYIRRPVRDLGQRAAAPFARRRLTVRVAPGLLDNSVSDDALAETLATASSGRWVVVRDALLDLSLPESVREDLKRLDDARRPSDVVAYLDLYGRDDAGRPRGAVFVAKRGVVPKDAEGSRDAGEATGMDGTPNATEDDAASSLAGFALRLKTHNEDVGCMAESFSKAAGLPEDHIADLRITGELHDIGKADDRFQAWLHYGDPLGPDPDRLLAKSGRRLPPMARTESELPDHWRHEALSVRLALTHPRFADAKDPELVLWLLGTHHGYGRPLFPHCDPRETPPEIGPQSLAFDWRGSDWPSLFMRLKNRYGAWELARLEAILRLADHRASEMRAMKDDL